MGGNPLVGVCARDVLDLRLHQCLSAALEDWSVPAVEE
jgi:hypothetical protein